MLRIYTTESYYMIKQSSPLWGAPVAPLTGASGTGIVATAPNAVDVELTES